MFAITARVSSAAFFSIAVTSTSRFPVFVEIFVCSEFIIGGKDIV